MSVYPELLGNGGIMSLNAEYLVLSNHNRRGYFLRAGFLGGMEGGTFDYLPFELGFLSSKDGKKFFEFSCGWTTNFKGSSDSLLPVRAGFRFTNEKGFLFRIAPMVLFRFHPDGTDSPLPWLGVSFGYSMPLNGNRR